MQRRGGAQLQRRSQGQARTPFPRLRAALHEHFSEQEVAALGMEIAMINLWNRIAISNH